MPTVDAIEVVLILKDLQDKMQKLEKRVIKMEDSEVDELPLISNKRKLSILKDGNENIWNNLNNSQL